MLFLNGRLLSGLARKNCWPRSWTCDKAWCVAAGIPEGTVFAAKPALARAMIARALDAGAPAAWVTGDEVYGADPGLRADLEARRIGYVLAVAASHPVITAAGPGQARAIAARLPRRAWQRYSAGAGAKGHRYYDWAWLAIGPGQPGHRHLLIRRNRHTGELAFYRCYSPRHIPLPALVTIAGIRWTTEENFQAGKGLTGLDEHPAEQDIECWFGQPIVSGERAAVEWWASWTEQGQELSYAGVTVLHFDNQGQVAEHRDYDNHVEWREPPYSGW